MQRKPTKNTRGPNADEKRFMAWIKEQPCCICNKPSPSIVDHMYGSCFRHNKVLIGHWAVLPYCYECDKVKTLGSHRRHEEEFGISQADIWDSIQMEYQNETLNIIPFEVVEAIKDWGR